MLVNYCRQLRFERIILVAQNYNAEVSANAVALPLERAINGVPGMTYMSSVTSNDGLTLGWKMDVGKYNR